MRLHLGISIISQPVNGFPTQALIDEVSCIHAPIIRHLAFSYLGLPINDGISNFSSTLSNIGPPAEHAFPSNDSDSEIIRSNSVIILAHHLRSHVAGSTTSLVAIVHVGMPLSCDTEISEF